MKACPWTLKDVFIVFIYAIAIFSVFCFWLSPFYIFFFPRLHLKRFLDLYAIFFFYASLFIAMKAKIFDRYRINGFEFFFGGGRLRQDIFYAVVFYLKFIMIVFLSGCLLIFGAAVWDAVFQTKAFEKLNFFFIASGVERLGVEERAVGPWGMAALLVFAPFFEELFFRGCLYTALRSRFSKPWSMGASSLFFSLLHGYFFSFAYVFGVGMLLAYLYEKRESLVPPLVFHMANNLAVLLLLL